MQPTLCFFGIDVSKAEFVAAQHPNRTADTVPNQSQPIRAWMTSLPQGSMIAIESTGGHERHLLEIATRLKIPVFLVDPRKTAHFARAMGYRGKTDRTDAAAIAHYLAASHQTLRRFQLPTPTQQEIDELLRRHARLVKTRNLLRQSLRSLPGLASESRALFDGMDTLLHGIEKRLQQLRRSEARLDDLAARIDEIPGYGLLGSLALGNLFLRAPMEKADKAVAFVGLDPRPHDSGKHKGQRKLTKHGPAELRRLLYLAAMAGRKTKLWKPTYERHLGKGLSPTEAILALARRMLRVAWALASTGLKFDPNRIQGTVAAKP